MICLIKPIFIVFLILLPIIQAFVPPSTHAQSARPAYRIGSRGLAVWKTHHGSVRSTFASTESVGTLVQYSLGIETSRYPVRIQRTYPNRLRLEMQVGALTRVLLYNGTAVSAEQAPLPTQDETELVLMLSKNSIEWIFGQVSSGSGFRLIHEGVTPEVVDRADPKSYDVLELVLPQQTMLAFVNRNNNRIELLRYWSNRYEIKVEFSNWQTGSSVQLPYKIVYNVNRQKRAELNLSQVTVNW